MEASRWIEMSTFHSKLPEATASVGLLSGPALILSTVQYQGKLYTNANYSISVKREGKCSRSNTALLCSLATLKTGEEPGWTKIPTHVTFQDLCRFSEHNQNRT